MKRPTRAQVEEDLAYARTKVAALHQLAESPVATGGWPYRCGQLQEEIRLLAVGLGLPVLARRGREGGE